MKKFLFFAALLSALCVCFSSCEKDDDYCHYCNGYHCNGYHNDRDNNGNNNGNNGNNGNNNGGDNGNNGTEVDPETFEVTTGTDGTGMSYQSWIEINGERYYVDLTANTVNINTELEVSSFELGNTDTYISYGVKNSSRNGNYTVTDSLMMQHIVHDNFRFSYDMTFQTARYDNGKVRQRMASLRFSENAKISTPTITKLSAQTSGGKVYARRLYRSSIRVTFNGVETTITANIILKRNLGFQGSVTVVDSEVYSSGIKNVVQDGNTTGYTSWITMKQEDVNGNIGFKTYELYMSGNMIMRTMSNTVTSANISKVSAGFDASAEHTMRVGRDHFVEQFYHYQVYKVKYNQFSAVADFMHSTATYDDGITTVEFPCYKPEKITDSYSMQVMNTYTDAHGSYKQYLFTFKMTCKYGNKTHVESESFDVVIPQ